MIERSVHLSHIIVIVGCLLREPGNQFPRVYVYILKKYFLEEIDIHMSVGRVFLIAVCMPGEPLRPYFFIVIVACLWNYFTCLLNQSLIISPTFPCRKFVKSPLVPRITFLFCPPIFALLCCKDSPNSFFKSSNVTSPSIFLPARSIAENISAVISTSEDSK